MDQHPVKVSSSTSEWASGWSTESFRSYLLRPAAAQVKSSACWLGIKQTSANRLEQVFVDLNQITLKSHTWATSRKCLFLFLFFCFVFERRSLRGEEFSGQLVEAFGGPTESTMLTSTQYFSEESYWGSGSTCNIRHGGITNTPRKRVC